MTKYKFCIAGLVVICLASAALLHADDATTVPVAIEIRLAKVFEKHIDKHELAAKTNSENPPYDVSTPDISVAVEGGFLVAKVEVWRRISDEQLSRLVSPDYTPSPYVQKLYDTSIKVPLEELKTAGFAVIPYKISRLEKLVVGAINVHVFEIKPDDKTDADSLAKRSDAVSNDRILLAFGGAFHNQYAKIKTARQHANAIETAREGEKFLKRTNSLPNAK